MWSKTHGNSASCTVHGPWEVCILYSPWPMGISHPVWSMTHGRSMSCTVHDPWEHHILKHPVRSMIHGQFISLAPWAVQDPYPHDPWAVQDSVRPCMAHGSWACVTSYGPWVMGKMSLKGVAHKNDGGEKQTVVTVEYDDGVRRQLPMYLLRVRQGPRKEGRR